MDTQNKALFESPKFSQYPWTHYNKFTTSFGHVTPVLCREMSPSERFSLGAQNLTRFAPLLAPVMDSFEVALDYHFVPSRILKGNTKYGIDFEAFHNPSTQDRPAYPKENLFVLYLAACEASLNGDGIGTLYDYLSLPTFETFDKKLRNGTFSSWLYDEDGRSTSLVEFESDILSYSFENNIPILSSVSDISFFGDPDMEFIIPSDIINLPHIVLHIEDEQSDDKCILSPFGFCVYLYKKKLGKPGYKISIEDVDSYGFTFEESLKEFSLTSSQFLGKYFAYLKRCLFYANLSIIPDIEVNIAPFLAYWRIIYDWYINTNIDGDPDTLFAAVDPTQAKYMHLFNRRYPNDIFTSAFSSAQMGSAVPIPANGTIPDLRSANQLQKFKERILYAGKRYIDNILVIFGQKSSNARFDRTQVLKRETSYVNIEAVTQTNQADVSQLLESPLGSLVGQGVSYKDINRSFDVTIEEHGFCFAFYSVRPRASYFQGIPRYFLKSDYFDFLVPGFDSIGEQDVKSVELFLDPTQGSVSVDANNVPNEIFGYNRRYYEYTRAYDEVHGDFRNSLDHWTAARIFTDKPTLSSDFIGVSDKVSNLNRIFASTNPDEQNIYCVLSFHGSIVTPISKYVDYDL